MRYVLLKDIKQVIQLSYYWITILLSYLIVTIGIILKHFINIKDEKTFFRLIKISFMQRRKTLINSLVNGGVFKSKDEAKRVFDELNLDVNVRGENLSMQDFADLADKVVG